MKYYCNLCFILVIISCSSPKQEAHKTPHVLATTGMLYDAVINIAGDKMTVDYMMGPGVDPHLYKASQGDLKKIRNADIIIYNGLMLEGKLSEILKKLKKTKLTVAAAEALPDSLLLSDINYENAYDPHVWFDVSRWKIVVETISKALIHYDTIHTHYYQQQTKNYLQQLDSLDDYVKSRIAEIPSDQRFLITAHDAFRYFGNAYAIEVIAIQGVSTVADFGLRDIANLSDLIISHQIKSIFVETSVSERPIQALITGCKERGHHVAIGGYLYSDAMGTLGEPHGTYIGMFRHNVNTLADALK